MEAGIIIIGDEILSGFRQDRHLVKSIELLGARGHGLRWCQVIGDDPGRITRTLVAAAEEAIPVFCFGGIGATPDDYTRQCAAEAFARPLQRHPGAVELIEQQFGETAYPNRILMADLPAHAELIPNPVNRVPGFSIGELHFLPGFPQMAWPMMEWVLQRYPDDLHDGESRKVLRVYSGHESEFIEVMNRIVEQYEGVKVASLPVISTERRYIDFVISGMTDDVSSAADILERRAGELSVENEYIEK